MATAGRKPNHERIYRFVEIYSRIGNAARAAEEAGYAKSGRYAQGARLLRNPIIREMVAAKNVNRVQHAEETYRNLILLGNIAMKHVADLFTKKQRIVGMGENQMALEVEGEDKEKSHALEAAGKALERLARCEGLLMIAPSEESSHRTNLQQIVQVLHQTFNVTPAEIAKLSSVPVNGNGHAVATLPGENGNGNGHPPATWKSIQEGQEGGNGAGNGKDS